MAGYLKKGASTWSTAVPSIYVKTGPSTWSSATSAWIKVNNLNDSTSWKQWFTAAVTDSFTRTTSGTLGVADLGGTWVNGTIAGSSGWYANGSAADTTDTISAGTSISTISLVEIGSENTFAEVTTSGGVGPTIWANYSGTTPTTWWAAIPYKIETATPYEYQGNCVCNATTTCNTCASAVACGSTSTPFSYNATPNYVYQGSSSYSINQGAAGSRTVQGSYATCSYSCPSGQTLGGVGNTSCYTDIVFSCSPSGVGCSYNGQPYSSTTTTGVKTCNATYGVGNVNSTQGSCSYPVSPYSDGGCETGTSGNYRGCKGLITSTVSGTCTCGNTGGAYVGPAPCSRTCPSGQSYPGSGTYCTYVVYDVCSVGVASNGICYTSGNSCAGSYSGSPAGSDCAYFTGYTCPNGGTLSGSTCSGTSVVAKTCASCSECGSTVTGGGTYPNCSPQGFTCQTLIGYNYSYSYGVKLVQGSGSSYTVISDTSTTSFAAVVRLVGSENTITLNAWSDTAKTTQVITNVTATNSGAKGNKCGIVRGYSQYQQGTTADNFSAGVI
jgi:conjugal transfer mating pair stabilization protein TraN